MLCEEGCLYARCLYASDSSKYQRVKMTSIKPAESFPRSSNGRTAAFGAVNRGSNPCRGANLKVGAWKRLSPRFLFHFQSSNTPKFERVHEGWILTVPPSNSPRQLPVPAVCAAPANSAVKLKRRSSTVTVVGQFDDLWSGFRTSARGNRVSSTPAISSTMVPCMLPATPICRSLATPQRVMWRAPTTCRAIPRG